MRFGLDELDELVLPLISASLAVSGTGKLITSPPVPQERTRRYFIADIMKNAMNPPAQCEGQSGPLSCAPGLQNARQYVADGHG